MKNNPRLLAIETSCDDTSVACLNGDKLLSNVVSSQIDGAKFGGIVPELASRAHQANMVHVVRRALEEARWSKTDVDTVAVTCAPGLLGSLLVGLNFARGFALGLGIPVMGIHHLEGHLMAVFLEEKKPGFPFIALIVSGGHTEIVLVRDVASYEVLGRTVDDAAGECFDKVARFVNLEPRGSSIMAGPMVDERAAAGNRNAVSFPRPMLNSPDFNFSFSGLKTSVLNHVRDRQLSETQINDVCASFQEAVVDVLTQKTLRACRRHDINRVVITGGVAANSRLRKLAADVFSSEGLELFIPAGRFCTDNAAMIGMAALLRCRHGDFSGFSPIPRATMTLDGKT